MCGVWHCNWLVSLKLVWDFLNVFMSAVWSKRQEKEMRKEIVGDFFFFSSACVRFAVAQKEFLIVSFFYYPQEISFVLSPTCSDTGQSSDV